MAKHSLPPRRNVLLTMSCYLLATAVGIGGCVPIPDLSVAQESVPCLSGTGTPVQGSFLVNVEDARWADETMPAGMEQMPAGYRTTVKPQASFLIIDLEIENVEKQPLAWTSHGNYYKVYNLVNEDGVVYDALPMLSSIGQATSMQNINPGMAATGLVVFDVPKGNYDFVISHASPAGPGRYRAEPVFRCSV